MANDLDEILALARKRKTPAQSRKLLIQAGIFSSAGKLADHYKAKSKADTGGKIVAKAKGQQATAKPKAAAAYSKAAASKAAKKIEA